jgi:hypothetical protein
MSPLSHLLFWAAFSTAAWLILWSPVLLWKLVRAVWQRRHPQPRRTGDPIGW